MPLLFTVCSEDVGISGGGASAPAWTSRISFSSHPNDTVVVMRSNNWPGLFAFASGMVADVVYFGWGHKNVSRNFSHPPLPPPQIEYMMGPDIMEINDPSVEEEEEYRKKLESDRLAAEGDTDSEGEGGDEETDEGGGIESEEN